MYFIYTNDFDGYYTDSGTDNDSDTKTNMSP